MPPRHELPAAQPDATEGAAHGVPASGANNAITTSTEPRKARTGEAVAARLAPRQPMIARCVASKRIHSLHRTNTRQSLETTIIVQLGGHTTRKISRLGRHGRTPLLQWPAYNGIGRHYIDHSRINHSAGIYVQGDTTPRPSRASSGTSRDRHPWELQECFPQVAPWRYLNEFTYRYNHRHSDESMFHLLA